MFVNNGAQDQLLKDERRRFIEKEWPLVRATIERLGLDAAELFQKDSAPADAGGEND
jgi:hypothetical protein